jgi:hypothetical protein
LVCASKLSDVTAKIRIVTMFVMWIYRMSHTQCVILHIQGVSRLYGITAGRDFLGLCDEKFHINMCPILDGYGVMTVF